MHKDFLHFSGLLSFLSDWAIVTNLEWSCLSMVPAVSYHPGKNSKSLQWDLSFEFFLFYFLLWGMSNTWVKRKIASIDVNLWPILFHFCSLCPLFKASPAYLIQKYFSMYLKENVTLSYIIYSVSFQVPLISHQFLVCLTQDPSEFHTFCWYLSQLCVCSSPSIIHLLI